jgi:hypothetical protein
MWWQIARPERDPLTTRSEAIDAAPPALTAIERREYGGAPDPLSRIPCIEIG